ncbi:hypothetical protein ASD15_11080 [Massilia sp. Root351]|jgi:uncharacterized membrane protein|uniref:DUF1700 domain-containing protein n=1 Tax=Massilia sp. Root351 TaxID=1736522 RepID=UPI00070C45AD|nr:DUF1700 domain-containing protein [Massilia sp. Root351]KQV82534.1 hypothetical protein ASD15_11080 [Massilia sp. Root351]
MDKQAYLDALQKALAGLPPDTVAKTLAYYEQRFVDGVMAGRTEQEIAADLGEPRKIAMTLRANVHLSAFEQKKTPVNAARMAVSVAGLAIFNLFMVVPAMVYAALLATIYVCAFSFYLSGIVITASGLSGTNELVLDGPLREFIHFDGRDGEGHRTQTKIAIDHQGIQIYQEPMDGYDAAPDAGQADADNADGDDSNSRSGKIIEKAERMATSAVHISTDLDGESRTTQSVLGMTLVIVGILLSLLSLVVTKYTIVGIKRYIQMNSSLLRGR